MKIRFLLRGQRSHKIFFEGVDFEFFVIVNFFVISVHKRLCISKSEMGGSTDLRFSIEYKPLRIEAPRKEAP